MLLRLARLDSRIYVLIPLLGAMVLSTLPYAVLAFIVAALVLATYLRPLPAGACLTLFFSVSIFMPLTWSTSPIGLWGAFLGLAALPALEKALRDYGSCQDFSDFNRDGSRRPSLALKSMALALGGTASIALLLANYALLSGCAITALFLACLLFRVLRRMPRRSLEASGERLRVVAGDTASADLSVSTGARLPVYARLAAQHAWMDLEPVGFGLAEQESVLCRATVTPPLSGPARPAMQASCLDCWGLLQTDQELSPFELNVIPRARYAEWLARNFLAESALPGGTAMPSTSTLAAAVTSLGGVEYFDSRPYMPGDSLKNIDWKKVCQVNELVVKGFSEARNQTVLITVNLTAGDAEEADRLAYALITLTLTLSTTATAAAIAAYNEREVLFAGGPSDLRLALKKALDLAQQVTISRPEERFLLPPDLTRLKKSMSGLRRAGGESAQRLLSILEVEEQALLQGVADHPAIQAIKQATRRLPPPATVAVISGWNHDAEALGVMVHILEKQGYRPMHLSIDTAVPVVRRPDGTVEAVVAGRPRGEIGRISGG